MEFEEIIADLVREQAAANEREVNEEVASLAEAELVSVQLSDRLAALEGKRVSLSSAFNYSVSGEVVRANPAWLLIKDREGEELVSVPAIALAKGLQRVGPAPSFMETRMGLTHILRKIMRERRRVRVIVGSHAPVGFIGAVYADHMDMIGLDTGEPSISVSLKSVFSVRIVRGF
ncbi:MAG: hypothetical protein Q4D87_06580 [Actinomycetaceae bacterium]|nr:hypothetical protein [Actinomycetaceae bacterium]